MNIDKIKTRIGEEVYNHINNLDKEQLKGMRDNLLIEIRRMSNNPPHTLGIDLKTALERETRLNNELTYINYKLS